jgi:hypothetical protein
MPTTLRSHVHEMHSFAHGLYFTAHFQPSHKANIYKLEADLIVTPKKRALAQWLTRCNSLYGNQSKTLFTPLARVSAHGSTLHEST